MRHRLELVTLSNGDYQPAYRQLARVYLGRGAAKSPAGQFDKCQKFLHNSTK